jgi:hypothetical protein
MDALLAIQQFLPIEISPTLKSSGKGKRQQAV